MQGRFYGIFLTVWALQGVPVLCAAGLLLHPCDIEHPCESRCDHGPDDNGHDHPAPPEGCGHEQDCPDDPCSDLTVGGERLGRTDDAPVFALAACLSTVDLGDLEAAVAPCPSLARSRGPDLPFPASDVPLRI